MTNRRTRDRKVAGSIPSRIGEEIFFFFFIQSQLTVLTFIPCPLYPTPCYRSDTKKTLLILPKVQVQVTTKHEYKRDPTKSGRCGLCCPRIVWDLSGKRPHTQLVKEHSFTVVSVR